MMFYGLTNLFSEHRVSLPRTSLSVSQDARVGSLLDEVGDQVANGAGVNSFLKIQTFENEHRNSSK
jgi:hypothetical protein